MSFESFSWFRTWPISGYSAVEGSLLNNSDSALSGNNGTVGTVVNSGSNVLGRCDPILLLVSCHYIYVVGGNCDARYPDVAQGNIKGKKSQSAWNVFRQIRPYRSGTSLSAVWDPVMAGKSTCPPYRLFPTVIPVPNETDRCFIFGGFGKSNSTHPMGFNDIWEIKIHKRSRCNASRRKNCAESNSTEEEMVWIPHKCKGSEVVRLGTSTLSSFEKDARSVQSVTPRKRFNAAGASWKDVLRKSVTSDKETDNEKFGLLIFGGMCIESTAVESHASTESVFSDMWLYLTAKDMWVQIHGRFDEYGGLDTAGITHIEDSPCARSRASLITVTCDTASEYTCDVYLFGGISGRGTLLNDLWHTRLDLDLIHYRLEWRKRNAEDDTAMNDTWPSCVNFKERESSREFGWNASDTKSVLCDPVVCMWRKIQWWDMIAVHPTLEPMAQIFLKKIVCRPAIIMNTRRKQEDGTHGAFGLPSCLWVCGPSSCTYRSNVWMLHPIESDVHDASLTRTPIWRFSTFSGAEIRDMGAAASSPASIYFEARLNHVACWSSADQELYVGFGIQGAGVPPRSLLDLWVIREIKVYPRE